MRPLTWLGWPVFFINLSYRISDQIFSLISLFLSDRQFRLVLDRKSTPACSINANVPLLSILMPTLLLMYTNSCLDVIYNIAFYIDDITLHSKCIQHYMFQQFMLTSELVT